MRSDCNNRSLMSFLPPSSELYEDCVLHLPLLHLHPVPVKLTLKLNPYLLLLLPTIFSKPLPEEPDSSHIRNLRRITKKIHEGQPVLAIPLHLLIRQPVPRLKDEHLHHQHNIHMRPTLPAVLEKRLKNRPERIPIHKPSNPTKPIPLRETTPILRYKNLPDIHTIPDTKDRLRRSCQFPLIKHIAFLVLCGIIILRVVSSV